MISDPFKNASDAFKRANPGLVALDKDREIKTNLRPRVRDLESCMQRMNKTEINFSLLLEEMKRKREILRYQYEGVTLRWADLRYTPDFVVFPSFPGAMPMMIEVKGPYIYPGAVRRFKEARAAWPEFGFQLWQRKGREWRKKL